MSRKQNRLMYPSVLFHRASCNLESSLESLNDTSQNEHGKFSGTEAREFYESLLKESTDSSFKRKSTRSRMAENSETAKDAQYGSDIKQSLHYLDIRKPNTKMEFHSKGLSSINTRQENLFLKMAQDGDVAGVKMFITGNKVNINATDPFGWTALMCAAKSGHDSCVTLLLRSGADAQLKNNQGMTAKDIAKQSGIQGVDMFDYQQKSKQKCKGDVRECTSHVEKTCETCKTKFVGPKEKHDTSTAHLFNCQYKSDRTFYHIPEDNIGFKLMKQKGWDKTKGKKMIIINRMYHPF